MGGRVAHLLVVALLVGGCQQLASQPPLPATMPIGLEAPQAVDSVAAVCVAPTGWKLTPLQTIDDNHHQMWLSGTGRTAFGVIHIRLPLPVGPDLVLWVLVRHMKQEQGSAALLSKQRDGQLGGLRFVAEDPRYRMRGNLLVRGRDAWVIYAGTNRNQPVEEEELKLAEQARELTRVGTR